MEDFSQKDEEEYITSEPLRKLFINVSKKLVSIVSWSGMLMERQRSGSERYADIKSISKYTSLPVKTIYDWSNQGKFPYIKYGRRILFDIQDVDKAMANLKRPYLIYEKTVNKIIGDL